MARVGRFITDPRAGGYCQITLDSGERIIVNHEHGRSGNRIHVEIPKFLGLSSQRIFSLDLDSPDGQSVLAGLTEHTERGTAAATPLGAFVQYLRECDSVAKVKRRCAALISEPAR
jgi:hypothetical protein